MQAAITRDKVEAEPPDRQRKVGNREHRSPSYYRNLSSNRGSLWLLVLKLAVRQGSILASNA